MSKKQLCTNCQKLIDLSCRNMPSKFAPPLDIPRGNVAVKVSAIYSILWISGIHTEYRNENRIPGFGRVRCELVPLHRASFWAVMLWQAQTSSHRNSFIYAATVLIIAERSDLPSFTHCRTRYIRLQYRTYILLPVQEDCSRTCCAMHRRISILSS